MPKQLNAEHLIFVQIKLISWVYKRRYIYGWFGDRIQVGGGDIFRTRQTGCGTHLAYSKMGTGSLSRGYSGQAAALTTRPHQ
jgi:hypothetical protein